MTTHVFTMRTASAVVYGRTVMTQSRFYAPDIDKLPRETADAYENRTWRNRLHTLDTGQIVLPVEMFKKSIENAATRLSESVPGKRMQTFSGRFRSDVQVQGDSLDEGTVLLYHLARDEDGNRIKGPPYMAHEVEQKRLHVSATGKRGVGPRVFRFYPLITEWIAFPKFVLTDPAITDEIFTRHIGLAGLSIGIGSFRMENGGRYGRFFLAKDIEWEENDLDAMLAT